MQSEDATPSSLLLLAPVVPLALLVGWLFTNVLPYVRLQSGWPYVYLATPP